MANTAQAAKRAKQAEVRRLRNASQRSDMRTAVKKVLAAINSGDKEQARSLFVAAQSKLDKMARKGIIEKNKAARSKSRINARIKAIA
ncbi:30S ribosomal protein S20 [Thiomicrospira cyclica]|uniref:Small ribosomal subunit protein bS20 n=1 Tax=Thiomicrospira cyclica (strain DSM 14477 / JCM 11371 / ALM1) TaxID=717773 RepID=F6D9U3_THICA|nr:30S ribosomal protein S20 [Thiomicrospira cyclica]AEG32142.1 30S ribosomal protein S20 [Thiomicrospira cyclica ALM1]